MFAARFLRLAALCAAIATIAGCDTTTSLGKKIDYKSTNTAPALEIPPDLTAPAYDERYQVSTASGAAAARATGKPGEVLPTNPDARLVRAGSERFLVVNATEEAAWKTVREFWTKNGFVIAVEQPQLGIMETDWAENRAVVPQDFIQQFMNKYVSWLNDTYKRDKFRTRIERGSEPGTVEIYVSHRGAAQLPTKNDKGVPEDWQWQSVPPNPELEAEFLARLMMAFGTPESQATQALAALPKAPDRARIEKGTDGASKLVVDDGFDRAWRRIGLALDRTGFTVVDRDRSKGLYFVRYANPDLDVKKDKGFLDKLQFWKTDETKPEQYRVVVTQADPQSVVTVQDPAGEPDRSPNSDKILALLKDQLK
ncbi:MAG TPA: outer membrane protein assembly factor BamC [Casimicrobiaceae bacterium]|nr:outer membrane protein assembly factor BamC [Casimicrobiaceae bacterium]